VTTTEPITRPATIDGGRWHCLLCQTVGYGGVTGWDEHYMAWHYNARNRAGGSHE
jgi:hypothetical protein